MLNILKRVVGVVAVLVVGAAGCSSPSTSGTDAQTPTESVVADSDSPVTQDALEGLRVVKVGDGFIRLTNATMGPLHLEGAVLNRGACTMVPYDVYGFPTLSSTVSRDASEFALTGPILMEVGARFSIGAVECGYGIQNVDNIVFLELNFTEGSGGFSF